jgi:Zn-finger nucleic acid-binding protein
MSSPPCPRCQMPDTVVLIQVTAVANATYYYCGKCGHVWTLSKDGLDTISHVTPLRNPKPPEQSKP